MGARLSLALLKQSNIGLILCELTAQLDVGIIHYRWSGDYNNPQFHFYGL